MELTRKKVLEKTPKKLVRNKKTLEGGEEKRSILYV